MIKLQLRSSSKNSSSSLTSLPNRSSLYSYAITCESTSLSLTDYASGLGATIIFPRRLMNLISPETSILAAASSSILPSSPGPGAIIPACYYSLDYFWAKLGFRSRLIVVASPSCVISVVASRTMSLVWVRSCSRCSRIALCLLCSLRYS